MVKYYLKDFPVFLNSDNTIVIGYDIVRTSCIESCYYLAVLIVGKEVTGVILANFNIEIGVGIGRSGSLSALFVDPNVPRIPP